MIFSRLVKTLRSPRLTIALIVCLIAIFLLGLMIPQKDLLRERYPEWKAQKPVLISFLEALDLTEIYTAPLTLFLWGLFFVNLLFIMADRVPGIWRRVRREEIPRDRQSLSGSRHAATLDGRLFRAVPQALRKKGYRVFLSENAFWAVRNRISPLGTVLFHLSFLLILLGGVMSFYTRFRAEADVAVGETFTGDYRWVRKARIGEIPRTEFTVERITPTYYQKDMPVDLEVALRTREGRHVIGINRPYREGALSFIVQDIDVAPLFILKDSAGREIEGGYVKLIVLNGRPDSFSLAGYRFDASFYTDVRARDDDEVIDAEGMPQVTKQFTETGGRRQHKEIVNPAFRVSVHRDGILIAEKMLAMNESLHFDGHELQFADLTYWAKFYVGKEYGLGILYTGFVAMCSALILRFVFYRRDIRGVLEGGELQMAGRSEFYPSLFTDEFRAVVEEIERSDEP